VVVNFITRLNNEEKPFLVEDVFPNKHLFSLSTNTPWFADIANYLAAWNIPQHLSTRES